ncbi:MAG: hypothetical protein ACRD82_09865 [Blastocatellia bacterium]
MSATTFSGLVFDTVLPAARTTGLAMTETLTGALVLTFAVFAVEVIRFVTFLVVAVFGTGFLLTTFGADLETDFEVLATTFLAALTGFGAAALGFAIVRRFDFDAERNFCLLAVACFGFVNFDWTRLPDTLAFAVVFALILGRLESCSLIRFPSLEK